MTETVATPAKEKKVLTPAELKAKEEKQHQDFLSKVKVLLNMSKKKDSEERSIILESNRVSKLTKSEWDELEAGTFKGFEGQKVTPSFRKEACEKFGLIKTYTTKASTGERKERTNMVDTIPEGKMFKSNLAKFLESQKVNIDAMSKIGVAFQPFYRNLNEKGKHGTKSEVPTQPNVNV